MTTYCNLPKKDYSHLEQQLNCLQTYVSANHYEGYDLYDGLNSRLFENTCFYQNRWFRLALIQLCKRSPINLRPLLMVPRGFNAKGGALFLLGHLHRYHETQHWCHQEAAIQLYRKLKTLKIETRFGNGWGYNFDWQARAFMVPVGTPNTVTSVYVGRAMLAYYQAFNDSEALGCAKAVARFLSHEMVLFETRDTLCFRYIPGEDTAVHNASLLAAAFLAQMRAFYPELAVEDKIRKAVRFSLIDVQSDGSWPYGTAPYHRWVDNFHTAFNIESLLQIMQSLTLPDLTSVTAWVTEYYLSHLFAADGTPKYYNHATYPVDVHVLAQALVLNHKLKAEPIPVDDERLDIIEQRLLSLTHEFQDPNGYFYHQKNAWGWNRIPYIRWGQAWMFYAFSTLLRGRLNGLQRD